MSSLRPLSEIVAGYPEDDPQAGDELLAADFDGLSELARELRRHLVAAVHSYERHPLATAADVLRSLELGRLPTLARKWVAFVLDARRRACYVPVRGGGMRWLRFASKRVPDPEVLARHAPLPPGGTYLLAYGGGPAVLSLRDAQGVSVADDIAALRARLDVCDVVFWELAKGRAPAMFSLAAGSGERDGVPLDFPDPAAYATAAKEVNL